MTKKTQTTNSSTAAFQSNNSAPGVVLAHGGYKRLLSYQKSQIVFYATMYFCKRFFDRWDRTVDQMIQAARSGKQNIIEGSQASGTSKEMELKLTSVARASLEELVEDYRDFLRSRELHEWPRDHPYAKRLREMNKVPGTDYDFFARGSNTRTRPFARTSSLDSSR